MYVDGKPNELETTLALEKQRKINDEFRKWIWQSEDRILEVEEAYNNSFGEFEREKYDGSTLEFPEHADGLELFDYQKNAIKKITEIDILQSGGIIVAERPLGKELPWEFQGYSRSRDYQYGKIILTLYRKQ